ncbi:uncharacterized protein LOC143068654 isoform X3 [Mytilus galloprovincialis]|uniref:uncharacterized protein LOC143068654 isoform X3 n=1 Tax=Mytilus galloprovincialis TaxID=29158 RepID=UPI003F7B5991
MDELDSCAVHLTLVETGGEAESYTGEAKEPRRDDHLQQNIPERSASRPYRPNEKLIARTEIFVSPNHTSEFSLMGDIESSYITPDGYFRHTIVFESKQEVWNSVCYGMLKLRNGDQLLSINNEDTTLLSHEDALRVFENLPGNKDENITMTYRRPSTRNVVDFSFELNCSLGHFTEERWIESNSHAMLRRYMDEEHKDYLHVTCDGNIILSSTCSVFKLKVERMHAFVIMEEIVTEKVLCLEDFNDCCAKFIHPTNYAADHINYIDHMEEKFRFKRDSVPCLRQ